MTVNGSPVTVTFSTTNSHTNSTSSTSWTPTSTFADGVVVGNAPVTANGIMQLTGGTNAVNTLSFSTPLTNPVLAIWSLGQPGLMAEFDFSATPVLLAGGPSTEFGGSSISVAGNDVLGAEGNGTVEFTGTFSSITWTNPVFENFYGFNVGAPTAVPEPTSMAVFGLVGVAGLGVAAWRRQKRAKA
jgi:hypothetical protein